MQRLCSLQMYGLKFLVYIMVQKEKKVIDFIDRDPMGPRNSDVSDTMIVQLRELSPDVSPFLT